MNALVSVRQVYSLLNLLRFVLPPIAETSTAASGLVGAVPIDNAGQAGDSMAALMPRDVVVDHVPRTIMAPTAFLRKRSPPARLTNGVLLKREAEEAEVQESADGSSIVKHELREAEEAVQHPKREIANIVKHSLELREAVTSGIFKHSLDKREASPIIMKHTLEPREEAAEAEEAAEEGAEDIEADEVEADSEIDNTPTTENSPADAKIGFLPVTHNIIASSRQPNTLSSGDLAKDANAFITTDDHPRLNQMGSEPSLASANRFHLGTIATQ